MIADLHTHNFFSDDSNACPAECYSEAINKGCEVIAVTNHYDIDGVEVGMYPKYDIKADSDSIKQAKDCHHPLYIIHGIELGQPHLCLDKALDVIYSFRIEYVLASLHNLNKCLDFSYWDYSKVTPRMCNYWIEEYLTQMLDMLSFPRIDAVAHLTYPVRYMRQCGFKFDLKTYEKKLARIFETMIKKNIALEVNTSGLRTSYKDTLPDCEIIDLYRKVGGELTVVGSDAHVSKDICQGIKETYYMLKALGFTKTYIPLGCNQFEAFPLL